LDRAQVLAAAVSLADRIGLEATTMRALAENLGVTPMALYKHIPDREGLIDGMVDTVVAGMAPVAPEVDWRTAIRTRILAARTSILRHPWSLGAIETRAQASPIVLDYLDSLIGVLRAGGFSWDLVHNAMHALSTRMWGFTRDVFPTPAVPADPAARAAMYATFRTAYPHIVAMATESPHAGAECDSDAEFVFALDLLLDGLERTRRAGAVSARPADTAGPGRRPLPRADRGRHENGGAATTP
jgi:AcrR family transcriptional regulator